MATASSMKITIDLTKALQDATKELVKRDLLIGIPGDQGARQAGPGEPNPPNNAVIAFVQEFGDDEKNIPARPFLFPGVDAAKPAIVEGFKRAGTAVLSGDAASLDKGLAIAGLAAQASVKKQILDGDFAPLSDRTLEARARRDSQGETSKAARRELTSRGAGNLPTVDAKPLYDTHSMFDAVTFVIRDKREG